jgi:CheY-like chemotaxis protein
VGVESTPGVGSTFWFTSRLRKLTSAAVVAPTVKTVNAEVALIKRYAGTRILVVDDEIINREITKMQLEGAELLVDTAEDGEEAVTMAKAGSYAAIFMDMQMPNMDGLEATRRIRELSGYGNTPIIALTANAFLDDRNRCLSAGMNDFLTKPFKPDDLFATLLRNLEQRKD